MVMGKHNELKRLIVSFQLQARRYHLYAIRPHSSRLVVAYWQQKCATASMLAQRCLDKLNLAIKSES